MALTIQAVKKGKHDFRPNSLVIGKSGMIEGSAMFWPSCRYDLGDSDQQDWNKLVGLSYNLLSNFKDAQMVGWRYNIEADKIELNHYCHIDGERVMGPVLMSVNINQQFYFALSTNRDSRTIHLELSAPGKDTVHSEYRYRSFGSWTRRIGAWFGGNRTAPHDMSFQLHIY